MTNNICHRCGQPVLEGQPRYTLGEFRDPPEFCHYDCKKRDDDKLSADLKNFKANCDKALALVEALRRRGVR